MIPINSMVKLTHAGDVSATRVQLLRLCNASSTGALAVIISQRLLTGLEMTSTTHSSNADLGTMQP